MAFSFFKKRASQGSETKPKILPKFEFKGGHKFATNETNDMYLEIEELGGFPFLKTIIIGDFSVNVKRYGGTLNFELKDGSLKLESDNTTIDSNQIKKTGVFVTEVDFELNEEDVARIKKKNVKEITYTFKKKSCSFSPL